MRSRKERDGRTVLVADMSVGYKAIRETFTTPGDLKPDERLIDVKYIDGPVPISEQSLALRAAPTAAATSTSSSTTSSRAASSAR